MNKFLRIFLPLVEKEVDQRVKLALDKEEETRKEIQKITKAPVEAVFKSGGIQYYKVKDLFNQNSTRCMAAISFYEELRMKCTREYLIKHLDAQKELNKDLRKALDLNNKSLNLEGAFIAIQESEKLDLQIKERLEWIFEPDCTLKLAGIVFFDENEDPFGYDPGHGIEKVNRWKKEGVDAFFLSRHMMDLVDYSSIKEEDFQKFTEVAEILTTDHLENISTILSKKGSITNTLGTEA